MSTEQAKITFLGGASEIGASCALVEAGDRAVLIDCGIRFTPGRPLPNLEQIQGKRVDAILVTHAHTDHTGALPVARQAFPNAPVYMTAPTLDLVGILQHDALRLMDHADRESEIPLYSESQVASLLESIVPVQLHQRIVLGSTSATFLPAAHILGAAMIHLETPAGSILFTGDFSVTAGRTVPALERPKVHADLIVTEATYGARLHSDRATMERLLVQRVTDVVVDGGKVLIPAFAIGRAQEVILILKQAMARQMMPKVPVYVDGMVRSVCAVYSRHPRYVPQQLAREIHHGTNPFFTEVITPVTRPQDREQIVNGGPCVIVSSSGMLWGGPSAGYAASLAPNPANAILITGYQDEESPGRALLNLAQQSGPRSLALADKTVPVECRFETYSLSAHADRMQIAGLIEALDPRSVVLVHGDRQAKQELADALYTRDVELADDGAVIVRGYPVRNKTATSVGPALLTPSAAVRIVGPATGSPLNAARMAEAWLGREPTAEETAALTAQLEDFGLIQRDSGSPDLLWPLTQPARLAQPTAEDLAMEQQLKEENPKGTLLEICMRRRLPPPRKLATIHRGRHAVELRITIDGQEIVSEPQFAHAEKMAEQLAARELLRQFSLLSPVEELRRITDADAAELRQTNPKGRLLELVAQNKWARPLIETRAVPNGFIGAASLRLPHGQTLQAVPAVASQNKIAEQAACASLLERAQAWMAETAPEGALPPATVPAARASGAEASPDPRMVLNELRQRAVIADFGYEQTNQHGPHHALVFTFLAWATTPDGRRIESGPVDGVNKRNAQLRAATDLVGLLTQHGAIANDPPEE